MVEGTSEVIVEANNGEMNEIEITGPLGHKVKGKYGYIEKDNLAVIEVAEACGLHLVPRGKRNPEITTTYAVGELIKAALDKGAKSFVIGLGGSATNDGGFGMLQALGVSGKDINNNEIKFGGIELMKLRSINFENLDKRIKKCNIRVACDVENPLIGGSWCNENLWTSKGCK